MYRVIGREVVGKGRLGRYIVEFSRKWPRGAKNVYLIGEFTSLYPGYMKLRRIGDHGFIRLKLWPGTYAYGFQIDNDFENRLDPDNAVEHCIWIPFSPENKTCLSKLVIEKPSNPLTDIYHNENNPSFLHKYMDKIIIRLKTPKNIKVLHMDLAGEKIEHTAIHDTGEYNVYEYHVKPRSVLSYRFWIMHNDEKLCYGDEGVGETASYITVDHSRIPGYNSPRWYMGTIYYQIFVDSYENGDPRNDPADKIEPTIPRRYGYLGGDIRGIIKRLDYIRDLGVETIYITPIFKSTSYHRYDTINYKEVDPTAGSVDDLLELINKLHEYNMKLVLDITMHHTNPCNEVFIKALEGDPKYRDFFTFLEDPDPKIIEKFKKYITAKPCKSRMIYSDEALRNRKPFYETFFHIWLMAKFNHDNPGTLEYFKDITMYWMDRGIDGFRIDVAMGIHYSWIKHYYYWVKNKNPEFLVLGELSEHPSIYMEYYDSAMDYYWRMIILEALVFNRTSIRKMVERLNELYTSMPIYKVLSLYNHLGSHDTVRIKTLAGDKRILKLLITLQFLLPGSPAVYYGDEIGLGGGRDPDNRRPMIWDREKWDMEIYDHVKGLIKLYREYMVLRHGFYRVWVENDVLVIHRWLGKSSVYGLVNPNNRVVIVKNKLSGILDGFEPVYSDGESSLTNNRFVLAPYGYIVLAGYDK